MIQLQQVDNGIPSATSFTADKSFTQNYNWCEICWNNTERKGKKNPHQNQLKYNNCI